MLPIEPWSSIPFSHHSSPLYTGCGSYLSCPLSAMLSPEYLRAFQKKLWPQVPEGEKDATASQGAASACLPDEHLIYSLKAKRLLSGCGVYKKAGQAFKVARGWGFYRRCSYIPEFQETLTRLGFDCSLKETSNGQRKEEEAQWFSKEWGNLTEKALRHFTAFCLEFWKEIYLLSCLKTGYYLNVGWELHCREWI